ncbi:MAG: putative bifunctional diguanylate cyclase/phosphodiesterase [Thermodesulfobacteriota bacterium]
MPYHYLRNAGFLLLVLLVVLLATLAVRFGEATTRQMNSMTSSLQNRLLALNQIDNALLHASLLYQKDSRLEVVIAEEILAALSNLSSRIDQGLSRIAPQRPEKKTVETSRAAIRQGIVSLLEAGQQQIDFTVGLLPQIHAHFSRLHAAFAELSYSTPAPLAPDFVKALLSELTGLERMVEKYLSGDSRQLETVLTLLDLADEQIHELQESGPDGPGARRALADLNNLLHTLRVNLPHVYETWQTYPTMSLAGEEEAAIATIWDELRIHQKELVRRERDALEAQRSALEAATDRKQRQFLTLATISVLFAVFFAFFINTVLARRISRLIQGTKRLADGELTVRIDMPARDPVGQLAASFNRMADSLCDKQRELRDSFELLQSSEKLLKIANEQLENRVRERTAALTRANAELLLMGNAFSHALEGILVADDCGRILKANPAAGRIVGHAPDTLPATPIAVFDSGNHEATFYHSIITALRNSRAWAGEVFCRRRDGAIIPLWLAIARMEEKEQQREYYIASFRDISDQKKQEMIIRHQAMHDALTGLPNRLLLKDQMHIAIAHAGRRRKKVVVLFMDLDNFKTINDTLGHAAGDAVLKGVAQRLKTLFRPEDTVCRIGGDEFVAIIGDLDSEDFALTIAERILKSLATPFPYQNQHLAVGGSIGMAVYPDDGTDSDTLIANADQAMYQAKQQGKNRIHFFSTLMHEYAQERLVREEEIRRGLAAEQFTLFFQPIINLATMEVDGFEALARWRHAERGILEPTGFLQVCEDAGLMALMGRRLLAEFCRLGREILAGCQDERLTLSLNLAASQIQEDNLVDTISGELRRADLDPARLTIEISETVIMADPQKTAMILLLLADTGIRIAIDDFGSGYHSLSFLKHLPIHALKIDRPFVRKALYDEYDGRLVAGVAALARHLVMQVVAEGVETAEQLAFVRQCGCHQAQGYLFARPMAAAEIPAFLHSWRQSGEKEGGGA